MIPTFPHYPYSDYVPYRYRSLYYPYSSLYGYPYYSYSLGSKYKNLKITKKKQWKIKINTKKILADAKIIQILVWHFLVLLSFAFYKKVIQVRNSVTNKGKLSKGL